MRVLWIAVCLLAVVESAPPSGAQETEPIFDPRPLVLMEAVPRGLKPVTSMDLAQVRQGYGLSLSPDGSQVAFVAGQANVSSNSYRSGIFVVGTGGSRPPLSLGSAGTPHWDSINQWCTEPPQWSGDGRFLTYRMRMRPDASWQVWRWDRHATELRPWTHVPGDVLRYRWDSSAKRIYLEVQLPVDRAGEPTGLEEGILYDGRVLPWEGIPAIRKKIAHKDATTAVWIHEVDTGVEREATGKEQQSFEPDAKSLEREFNARAGTSFESCHIGSAKLSPDNRSAALVCSPEEIGSSRVMRWRFYLMPGDGRDPVELARDSNRITDYWWSGEGDLYYAATQGDGRAGRMMSFRASAGEEREFFHTSEILREFSMDSAGRLIACTREIGTSPARIALIDRKAGTLTTLVDLNPEFGHLQLAPVERISGVNGFGEEWFGHLVKPPGYEPGKRYPLIVTLYRSGDYFLLGASGNENPIQVYAANGFAVLSFDIGRFRFRKPGDFEDHLLDWASPTASLEMAVQTLVQEGLADPERVGISGFSHGAEILEYAISHTHSFHAAVESGPAARDPFFYYMAGRSWQELFASWGLGGWPEGQAAQNWKRLAASLNADQIGTPLLVNSADSEFLASLALCASLEQLHKPVELHIYANELHVKNQPKHRYEIYERNLDWFRFWLQGKEDMASAKSQQYARWRKLREDSRKPANALAGQARLR